MKIKKIAALLMTAAIMVLIFFFSSQNADSSSKTSGVFAEFIANVFCNIDDLFAGEQEWVIDTLQSVIRNIAHFVIYAILGISLANCMRLYKRTYVLAPFICLAYAVSDEFHQYFVSGRSCELSDVLLDFAGGIIGTLFYVFIRKLIRRLKHGWNI